MKNIRIQIVTANLKYLKSMYWEVIEKIISSDFENNLNYSPLSGFRYISILESVKTIFFVVIS